MTNPDVNHPCKSVTGSRRKQVSAMKMQLADEAFWARVRFDETGKRPSHEDAPLLMGIWQNSWDALVADGPTRTRSVHRYKSLHFLVTSSWGTRDDLLKFQLRDWGSGTLLLAGDASGPLFPATASHTNRQGAL